MMVRTRAQRTDNVYCLVLRAYLNHIAFASYSYNSDNEMKPSQKKFSRRFHSQQQTQSSINQNNRCACSLVLRQNNRCQSTGEEFVLFSFFFFFYHIFSFIFFSINLALKTTFLIQIHRDTRLSFQFFDGTKSLGIRMNASDLIPQQPGRASPSPYLLPLPPFITFHFEKKKNDLQHHIIQGSNLMFKWM